VVEIYIDNTLLDTSDAVAFPLNFSIADIREPSKRQQSFSKTISLPSSDANNKLFTHAFNVNRSGGYNPNLKADCLVLQDSIEVFKGSAQLKKVTQKGSKIYGYDIVIYGKLSNIFFDIARGKLSELDFSEFDHAYTKTNQDNSWDTSIIENAGSVAFALGNGYVYPLIDYGYSTNQVDFKVTDLKPALYAKTVVDKIFSTHGYTYDSTFFDSTFFKSLIVPFTRQRLEMDSSEIEAKLFQAGNSAKQEIEFASAATPTSALRETIEFDDDSTGGNFDNGGNYDTGAYQYTVPDNGIYSINTRIYVGVRLVPDTPGIAMTPTFTDVLDCVARVLINGTPVNTQVLQIDFGNIAAFTTSYESANTIAQPDPNGIFLGSQFSTYSNLFSVYTNSLQLTAGDTVEIEFFPSSGSSQWQTYGTNERFIDGSLNLYGGDYYLQVKTGSTFYNKVDNTAVIEGGTVNMSNVLPVEIEQKDFLSSIVKMFNLYVEQDKDNAQNYLIEPRNDFYVSANEDWELKLDEDSEQDIIPMGVLDAARYLYSYKQDKDYYNELYESTYGEVYGQHIEDVNNDFLKNEKKTELIFSPTPLADNGGASDMVMSRIFQVDSSNNIKPYAANIRLLYYGGLKTINGGQWNHIGASATSSFFTYPYCGHLDDPFNPSVDLNFGIVKEVYYNDNWQDITWTNNNIYNIYHSQFIDEITSEDSILFTGYFRLRSKDVYDIDFRNQYYFKNSYWRLNKVIDFDPSNDSLTKCEFVKIKEVATFSPTTVTIIGAADDDVEYPTPKMKTTDMTDGNSFTKKMDIVVGGSGNIVAPDARMVTIQGNDNIVSSKSENIHISGDGNFIGEEASNVVLINSDNLSISESDVTYINGNLIDEKIIALRTIQTLTSSGTMSNAYRTTLCDTSSGDIDLTITAAANSERLRFTIKKIDAANNVNITTAASDDIDGSTTITLTSLNDSVELESDGTQYNIV